MWLNSHGFRTPLSASVGVGSLDMFIRSHHYPFLAISLSRTRKVLLPGEWEGFGQGLYAYPRLLEMDIRLPKPAR